MSAPAITGVAAPGLTPAFQTLRANLELSMSKSDLRHLVVASLSPQLPAGQIVLGLGHAFAQVGVDVLLADADSQQPVLHAATGAALEPGLLQWLRDPDLPVPTQHTDTMGVSLLAAGGTGLDPLQVLSALRVTRAMASLQEVATLVIWHVPALQSSTAGELLAAQADATLLAIRSGQDRRRAGRCAKQRLDRAQAHVVGTVACSQDRRGPR